MRNRDIYLKIRKYEPKKDIDLYAIAIIMTERRFRRLFFRLTELCLIIFRLLPNRRLEKVTIGVSQVRLEYWREYFLKSNLNLVFLSFSLMNNYRLASAYLTRIKTRNEREILEFYNGRPSKIYVEEFRKNYRELLLIHKTYK